MILLTGLYQDADPIRHGELLECLQRNLNADRVDEIHLLVEEAIPETELSRQMLSAEKIHLSAHGRRVTFQDLFAYANRRLERRTVIIANADIYFDHTLALLDEHDLSGKLLCLSRWDVQPDGSARFFEHPASQDAWIFQSPVPDFPCNFHLGVLGCDNRVACEAANAGLKLCNPSRSLRAYHLHLSQVRRCSPRWLPGPAKSVPAVFLETPYPSSRGYAPDAPCASVAFRETMGYNIARLDPGASSHTNEARPFTAIPAPLSGLQFTQVVSWRVSRVEVEFLSQGKLYVLVGNDWEGHRSATTWLAQAGFKEKLPVVETEWGTGFEAWSLVGDKGARFVLPTQVMLVADRLVRRLS